MGGPDIPASPDPAKSYEKEIQIYLQNLPQLLAQEQAARAQYDPQRIEEQQALQGIYGPTQYNQQLEARAQLDPYGTIIRNQLGNAVSSDLQNGYKLPDDFAKELENQIRGAQAARGNVLGNAPVTAEAAYKGKAAIDLYQSHLDNAGQFLGLSTPEQQIQAITPVSPDRTSAYVNPNAGFLGQQFALSNYGNQLGQYNAQTAQGNPWARALSGAASGAAAGSAGGGWGSLIGAVAGGVGGYASSDCRLKEDIILVGETQNKLQLFEFSYKDYEGPASFRYRGVMAQEVYQKHPEAVTFTDEGFMMVDYDKLGLKMEIVDA